MEEIIETEGNITVTTFKQNGEFVAKKIVVTFSDAFTEHWFDINDRHHRTGGPAIRVVEAGQVIEEEYFQHGVSQKKKN